MMASMLRFDATRMMKAALAGTQTKRLIDVLQGAFGTIDPASLPHSMVSPTEEEEEQEEGEEESDRLEESKEEGDDTSLAPIATDAPSTSTSAPTATLSRALKRKAPPPPSGMKRSRTAGVKGPQVGICSLSDAQPIYPSTADKTKYHHTGIEERFISHRKGSSSTDHAGYVCHYTQAMQEEGKVIKSCDFFSTVKAQLSTHIRQFHLGTAVCCFVCGKKSWAAKTWIDHMRSAHSDLQEDDFFVREGTNVEELRHTLLIKEEIAPEDVE